MARFCWRLLWEPMPTRPKRTLGPYVLGRARGEGWRDRRRRCSRWTRPPPAKLLCAFTQIGRRGVTFFPGDCGVVSASPVALPQPIAFSAQFGAQLCHLVSGVRRDSSLGVWECCREWRVF